MHFLKKVHLYFSGVSKEGKRFYAFAQRLYANPVLVITVSFLTAIGIGTILLLLPCATQAEEGISFVDALFTATSATCVTGLIVKDTGSDFTLFGQLVILFLIQIGGLGIMTLSSFFLISFGRRLSIAQQIVVKDSLDLESLRITRQAVRFVVLTTVIIECIGAIMLFISWPLTVGGSLHRWYISFFHSISAFCNAGFSLFSTSLVAYQRNYAVTLTVAGLIIVGGIGYFVLVDAGRRLDDCFKKTERKKRFSLHSKLVAMFTVILIVGGMLGYLLFERQASLAPYPPSERILIAFFQSVTPRTAGFATVDISTLQKSTLQLLIFLMVIGGAPGSTAGGIKVTVFALLALALWARLRGRREIVIAERTIPGDLIDRAVVITMIVLSVMFLSSLLVNWIEDFAFEEVLFEVVSALGTVGLSCGITMKLSALSRLIITGTMFFGRIGPLVLSIIIAKNVREAKIRYPEERVMLG
ncbi:MAG: hypothetical protein JW844_06610 [Candidatus Omnitrophica bacterium]|nr:hypothetical protein [Candidatus Omnitrophota bacterium]